MAADLLSTIRAEIDARIAELGPVLEEYEGLRSAATALGVSASAVPGLGARRGRRAATGASVSTRARGGGVGGRGGAIKAGARASSSPRRGRPPGSGGGRRTNAATAGRAPRGAAGRAILAALEHGSHTIRELVVVTAMSDPNIRANIRRMIAHGTIVKVSREGKAAYALTSTG